MKIAFALSLFILNMLHAYSQWNPSHANSTSLIYRTGNIGIGSVYTSTRLPGFRISLGNEFANTKIALLDNASTASGFGVQSGQFRLHLDLNTSRFSFLNAPSGIEVFTVRGTGEVGIGTSLPSSKLHIADGSLLVTGTGGATPVSGAGTRLMWIPSRAALRAGTAAGSEWDDLNIGANSAAFGVGVIASGNASFASGSGVAASGQGAVAMGETARASGSNSLAMGKNILASAPNSVVIGYGNSGAFENNIAGSLKVGFNSDSATFFVSTSPGSSGSTGSVGIATTQIPSGYKLAVNGKVICEEVRVDLRSNWPDYVFTESFRLMPLNEVAAYIKVHGHLPEVPSATEVRETGIALGEMNEMLLKKIEELTLYMIGLKEDNEQLRTEVEKLKKQK